MKLDVAIIGAGHNGLILAAYLARAGLKVTAFERRSIVGGACVTEPLWPGFRVSRAAYVAGLLRPVIIREFKLHQRGLTLLKRDPSSCTPLRDGRNLFLGADTGASQESIRQFSEKDARNYPAYIEFLEQVAQALEPWLDHSPPNPWRPGSVGLANLVSQAKAWWKLGAKNGAKAFSLLLGAARPALESWFESEPLLGTLATDALIGAWAAPSTPGTGYVLSHHVMGETWGERGIWAYVQGGMGSLSQLLSEVAVSAGAVIELESSVQKILVDGGKAKGILLEDGRVVESRAVVSNADPRITLDRLLGTEHLSEEIADELASLDFRSPVLKMNLALDRLPAFHGQSRMTPGPEHQGTIHLGAQTLDELEASFQAAERGRLPERPMIEFTIPSALDSSLAPEGKWVASLFVQHVPYQPHGSSWKKERDSFGDRILRCVEEVAPGFQDSVLEREILAPPDLEEIFQLSGGNIFHGAMTPNRLLFLRPTPSLEGYATPIQGLYLCGAGTHPGGGVMGSCGRNAAQQVLRDFHLKRPVSV